MDSNAPRVHRQQALAAYVEPLVVGRRVAVIGDASLGLAARIAELGARSVHLWDPDRERARSEGERAPRGVVVSALPAVAHGDKRDEPVRSFDLVVIPDLELFDDAAGLLSRVRRLVGEDGAVLVSAPNRDGADVPEGFDYYELFDLLATHFHEVVMIAQLPFYGVALAELRDEADESPVVTVDMQFAGANRTPEAFVALASQRGVRLDPYAIVELAQPLADAEEAEAEAEAASAAERTDEEDADMVRAALLHAAALEEDVAELRTQVAALELEALAATSIGDALHERTSRVLALEGALAEQSRQLDQLLAEAERMRSTIETQGLAAAQLEDLVVRAERAERALAISEPDVARAAEFHASEMARYEEALRERAKLMRSLEVDLAQRERMVRELVDAIADGVQSSASAPDTTEQPRMVSVSVDKSADGVGNAANVAHAMGPHPKSETDAQELLDANAGLRHKLDALALDLARREGEAQASAWALAELERRLAEQAQSVSAKAQESAHREPSSSDSEIKRQLSSALDELDVLRRALAQEHETRVRAEAAKAEATATREDAVT